MTDLKDLLLIFVAGLVVGYILRGGTAQTAYTNSEEWEIIKDQDGRVRGVKIHRRAEVS